MTLKVRGVLFLRVLAIRPRPSDRLIPIASACTTTKFFAAALYVTVLG